MKKSTYHRLTKREEEVVRRKSAYQDTEQEATTTRECNDIILEEHYDIVRTHEIYRSKVFIQTIEVKRQTADSLTENHEYQAFQL